MRLEEILTKIYDTEQNIKISTFWDGGWNLAIGDYANGWIDSQGGDFDTIEDLRDYLISWLDDPWFKKSSHIPPCEFENCKEEGIYRMPPLDRFRCLEHKWKKNLEKE